MSGYSPDFKQPPWVYGPKETMEWIEATHPGSKQKQRQKHVQKLTLKDVHIRLDLDVKQQYIKPGTFFSRFLSKMLKKKMVENEFDLFFLAEVFLRSLTRAKFRNTIRIKLDKNILYYHPEESSGLRKTINLLSRYQPAINKGKTVEISAQLSDIKKCTVRILINKVHSEKDHAINISFQGEIKRELYYAFVNYFVEKLGITDESLIEKIRQ
jgi:hypothetical protein